PLPSGGRLPRSEAAIGLGGVSGVDQKADRADHPDAVAGHAAVATAAVPAARSGGGRVVVPPAVEPAEDAPERPGSGAAAVATPGGNPTPSVPTDADGREIQWHGSTGRAGR